NTSPVHVIVGLGARSAAASCALVKSTPDESACPNAAREESNRVSVSTTAAGVFIPSSRWVLTVRPRTRMVGRRRAPRHPILTKASVDQRRGAASGTPRTLAHHRAGRGQRFFPFHPAVRGLTPMDGPSTQEAAMRRFP